VSETGPLLDAGDHELEPDAVPTLTKPATAGAADTAVAEPVAGSFTEGFAITSAKWTRATSAH